MTDSSARSSRLLDGTVLRVRNPQLPKQVSDIAEIPEDEEIQEFTDPLTGSQENEVPPETNVSEPVPPDAKSEVLDRGYGWVLTGPARPF